MLPLCTRLYADQGWNCVDLAVLWARVRSG